MLNGEVGMEYRYEYTESYRDYGRDPFLLQAPASTE